MPAPKINTVPDVDPEENRQRMKAGELYYAFTPDLMSKRKRCILACAVFNKAEDVSRRDQLEMLREYIIIPEAPLLSRLCPCTWLDRTRS